MDTWWSGSTKSKKKSTETRKEDRCTSTTWKAQTLSGTSIDFPHEPTEKYRIPATQFKTTLNYKIFLKKKIKNGKQSKTTQKHVSLRSNKTTSTF